MKTKVQKFPAIIVRNAECVRFKSPHRVMNTILDWRAWHTIRVGTWYTN